MGRLIKWSLSEAVIILPSTVEKEAPQAKSLCMVFGPIWSKPAWEWNYYKNMEAVSMLLQERERVHELRHVFPGPPQGWNSNR